MLTLSTNILVNVTETRVILCNQFKNLLESFYRGVECDSTMLTFILFQIQYSTITYKSFGCPDSMLSIVETLEEEGGKHGTVAAEAVD